jgi:hypothetical protein
MRRGFRWRNSPFPNSAVRLGPAATPTGQKVRSAGAHVCFVPFVDIGLHPYLVRSPPTLRGVFRASWIMPVIIHPQEITHDQ